MVTHRGYILNQISHAYTQGIYYSWNGTTSPTHINAHNYSNIKLQSPK